MASRPGCVSNSRLRDDAGTDNGDRRYSLLREISEPVPQRHRAGVGTEADVLKAWEGLGYYRRARQLQAAAQQIVREHGGAIPDDPVAVRALPGVGRYIAGAVLSFAFDRPEPIVEANSQRVLARLLALPGDLKNAMTQKRIWRAAERLVPARGPGIFNQALMELGALVCTPRQPGCLICPLSALCEARRLGLQDRLPVTTPRPAPLAVTEACAILVRDGQILIVQRGEGGLWERFWEFPTIHLEGANPAGGQPAPRLTWPRGSSVSRESAPALGRQSRH